jgi:hypothetical protein
MLSIDIVPLSPAPTSQLDVPSVDLTNPNYVLMEDYFGTGPTVGFEPFATYGTKYLGPSPEVKRIAVAVASEGTILPISPPELNSTWDMQFLGPSFQCNSLEGRRKEELMRHFLCAYCLNKAPRIYTFASWTGRFNPFKTVTDLDPTLISQDTSIYSSNSTSLYVASLPPIVSIFNDHMPLVDQICRSSDLSTPWPYQTVMEGHPSPAFIECETFNSSYNVRLSYRNGEQRVTSNVTRHELFEGKDSTSPDVIFRFWRCKKDPKCVADTSMQHMPGLVYNALIDSFSAQLKGWIGHDTHDMETRAETNILTTTLLRTKELQNLMEKASSSRYQSWVAKKADPINMGFKTFENATQPLTEALEEMFQNITISMMSSSYLKYVAVHSVVRFQLTSLQD